MRRPTDLNLISRPQPEPRRQALADQHILRFIVRPRAPHFPPRMRDPHARSKVLFAECQFF